MKKNTIYNILLILSSALITFILLEVMFRIVLFGNNDAFDFLRNPSFYAVYPKDKYEDFFDDDYWKLNFRFNLKTGLDDPDPLLGWTEYFENRTYEHYDRHKLKGRKPVLLFGDSFAMCVEQVDCFQDILNNDSIFARDHFLFNYGVGGYGVDQIYLLFSEVIDKYEDPFVIFSMLTTDLDRSMLKIRDAQKPYFTVDDGELQLKGTPITQSTREYVKKNPPKIKSYILNKLRNSEINPFMEQKKRKEKYIKKVKDLNHLILGKAFTKLKQLGDDYIVLIFQPEHHNRNDWRLHFLRDLCEEHQIRYFCDIDLRETDTTFAEYNPSIYAIPGDGHPTTYLNTLISKELKNYILDKNYWEVIQQRNITFNEREPVKDIEYYTNKILSTPEWLEKVKKKARAKGISLDSMIYIDAEYMVEKE